MLPLLPQLQLLPDNIQGHLSLHEAGQIMIRPANHFQLKD